MTTPAKWFTAILVVLVALGVALYFSDSSLFSGNIGRGDAALQKQNVQRSDTNTTPKELESFFTLAASQSPCPQEWTYKFGGYYTTTEEKSEVRGLSTDNVQELSTLTKQGCDVKMIFTRTDAKETPETGAACSAIDITTDSLTCKLVPPLPYGSLSDFLYDEIVLKKDKDTVFIEKNRITEKSSTSLFKNEKDQQWVVGIFVRK